MSDAIAHCSPGWSLTADPKFDHGCNGHVKVIRDHLSGREHHLDGIRSHEKGPGVDILFGGDHVANVVSVRYECVRAFEQNDGEYEMQVCKVV